jgi:hypothetical protein
MVNGKRYLIHDRDPLFTAEFLTMLAQVGVQSVKLPPRSLEFERARRKDLFGRSKNPVWTARRKSNPSPGGRRLRLNDDQRRI